jgi:hypothetical protein
MYGEGTQCGGTRRITASAGNNGNGIRWTDGSGTGASRNVGTGTYYAVTTSADGCESGTASVAVTINPAPNINLISGDCCQTVDQNTPLQPISFTATNFDTFTMTGGEFPEGVYGSPNGSSYTISGTPIVAGSFYYGLTASANGCPSDEYWGDITVNDVAMKSFASASTWYMGDQVWSDRVVVKPDNCTLVEHFTLATNPPKEFLISSESGVERYYFNQSCAIYACPEGWSVPGYYDLYLLYDAQHGDYMFAEWGGGGEIFYNTGGGSAFGAIWSYEPYPGYPGEYYYLMYKDEFDVPYETGGVSLGRRPAHIGLQVRCVKL